MEKLKIALCGCAGKAEKFGTLVNDCPESKVYAVWDADREQAQRVADILGGCYVAEHYEQILADPQIDGVMIRTDSVYHAKMALAAAKAKKHIFLEKPLSLNAEEAYLVRDAVKENGCTFFMSDPFVNATTIYAKQLIASGKLGKLVSVRIRFSTSPFLRRCNTVESASALRQAWGGGIMSDIGGHPIHMMHYLLGKPNKISAAFVSLNEDIAALGFEHHAAIIMEYPDQVLGLMEAGLMCPRETSRIEIGLTGGIIEDYSMNDTCENIRYYTRDTGWVDIPQEDLPEGPVSHVRYWIDMMAQHIPNEMVGVDNRSTHGVSIDSAVEFTEMIDAIYKAAKNGTPVA